MILNDHVLVQEVDSKLCLTVNRMTHGETKRGHKTADKIGIQKKTKKRAKERSAAISLQ